MVHYKQISMDNINTAYTNPTAN